jgi:hypothetical protein
MCRPIRSTASNWPVARSPTHGGATVQSECDNAVAVNIAEIARENTRHSMRALMQMSILA